MLLPAIQRSSHDTVRNAHSLYAFIQRTPLALHTAHPPCTAYSAPPLHCTAYSAPPLHCTAYSAPPLHCTAISRRFSFVSKAMCNFPWHAVMIFFLLLAEAAIITPHPPCWVPNQIIPARLSNWLRTTERNATWLSPVKVNGGVTVHVYRSQAFPVYICLFLIIY